MFWSVSIEDEHEIFFMMMLLQKKLIKNDLAHLPKTVTRILFALDSVKHSSIKRCHKDWIKRLTV